MPSNRMTEIGSTDRYRIGKLLELLSRNEKLESSTHLDEYETRMVADVLRDFLERTSVIAE